MIFHDSCTQIHEQRWKDNSASNGSHVVGNFVKMGSPICQHCPIKRNMLLKKIFFWLRWNIDLSSFPWNHGASCIHWGQISRIFCLDNGPSDGYWFGLLNVCKTRQIQPQQKKNIFLNIHVLLLAVPFKWVFFGGSLEKGRKTGQHLLVWIHSRLLNWYILLCDARCYSQFGNALATSSSLYVLLGEWTNCC